MLINVVAENNRNLNVTSWNMDDGHEKRLLKHSKFTQVPKNQLVLFGSLKSAFIIEAWRQLSRKDLGDNRNILYWIYWLLCVDMVKVAQIDKKAQDLKTS